MQLSNSVDLVRHACQQGHSNALGFGFLDQGHSPDSLPIAGESLGDLLKEASIDVVDAGNERSIRRSRGLYKSLTLKGAWEAGSGKEARAKSPKPRGERCGSCTKRPCKRSPKPERIPSFLHLPEFVGAQAWRQLDGYRSTGWQHSRAGKCMEDLAS